MTDEAKLAAIKEIIDAYYERGPEDDSYLSGILDAIGALVYASTKETNRPTRESAEVKK